MKIDRKDDTCFHLRFVYAFISDSGNKGISMDSKQKSGQK